MQLFHPPSVGGLTDRLTSQVISILDANGAQHLTETLHYLVFINFAWEGVHWPEDGWHGVLSQKCCCWSLFLFTSIPIWHCPPGLVIEIPPVVMKHGSQSLWHLFHRGHSLDHGQNGPGIRCSSEAMMANSSFFNSLIWSTGLLHLNVSSRC